MYEQEQAERLRERLQEAINKVPDRVRNGSIQATRSWMKQRAEAVKLLKKRNASGAELISAINALQ